MSSESELLVGVSIAELEALADARLAPAAQCQLDDFLARQNERALSPEEQGQLDRLLLQVDQLTILKTRARFTLSHQRTAATGT